MYLGSLLFCLIMVLPLNLCFVIRASIHTTPWLVAIHKQSFIGRNIESIDYHCAGVLINFKVVLTSLRCLNKFPENSQMVVVAGDVSLYPNMDNPVVQKYNLYDNQLFGNSKLILIIIEKSINPTKYVGIINQCSQQNCLFDKFGFQYGWGGPFNGRVVTRHDFSNSSALCMDLNIDPQDKYCTPHICDGYSNNLDGQFVIKIYKRKPILMAFWDYDDCDKKVRVFDRLRPDSAQHDTAPRRKLF